MSVRLINVKNFLSSMTKRGIELPLSTIIVALIILIFFIIAIAIIAGWGDRSDSLLQSFGRLFR